MIASRAIPRRRRARRIWSWRRYSATTSWTAHSPMGRHPHPHSLAPGGEPPGSPPHTVRALPPGRTSVSTAEASQAREPRAPLPGRWARQAARRRVLILPHDGWSRLTPHLLRCARDQRHDAVPIASADRVVDCGFEFVRRGAHVVTGRPDRTCSAARTCLHGPRAPRCFANQGHVQVAPALVKRTR